MLLFVSRPARPRGESAGLPAHAISAATSAATNKTKLARCDIARSLRHQSVRAGSVVPTLFFDPAIFVLRRTGGRLGSRARFEHFTRGDDELSIDLRVAIHRMFSCCLGFLQPTCLSRNKPKIGFAALRQAPPPRTRLRGV